jgi:hypothetical protein
MASELFSFARVAAEQCVQGQYYDVAPDSDAEEWAMMLWARILEKALRELYNEHGVVPPALVQTLISTPLPMASPPRIRISYAQLAADPAAQTWYDRNKENDLHPDRWFKFTDGAQKCHYVRAPLKATDGLVQCYRVLPSHMWKFGFVAVYQYSPEVAVRLNCQKRGAMHCHYGDRPPGTNNDRSYACSTAIGLCVLHEGSAIPLFPDKDHNVSRQLEPCDCTC